MMPIMLSNTDPESERRRYKIVRLDTCQDVPGLILSADIGTGVFMLRLATGEAKEDNLGPNGFRIITVKG